jgi:hypothetical protein
MYAVADIGNGIEVLKLYIEEMNDPNSTNTTKRCYQLQNIEKYRPAGKSSQNTDSSISPAADKITIADLFAYVKNKDNGFKPNLASKVVNADGTPKVVYHGTNAEFNAFHSKSGAYWFSEYEDYAESMMEERGGGEVKAVYLNMRNPYRAKLPPGKFSDPNYEAPILREARAAGYDGVIIENDTTNPIEAETFYVVFSPEQIKSATDNVGTFDGHNPDIRYSMSSENEHPISGSGYNVYGKDLIQDDRLAPLPDVAPTPAPQAAPVAVPADEADDQFLDDIAPMSDAEASENQRDRLDSLTDDDAPPEMDAPMAMSDSIDLPQNAVSWIAQNVRFTSVKPRTS